MITSPIQIVSLIISDANCRYTVNGQSPFNPNSTNTFDIEHNVDRISRIQVELLEVGESGGHVKIENITFDNEVIHHWDNFGVYRTKQGEIKKTYGWMDQPGTYTFKIRHSQSLHCYMMYMLDIVK